jgi:Flp pilus assembly protein TadG
MRDRKAKEFMHFFGIPIRRIFGSAPQGDRRLRCIRGEEGTNLVEAALALSILFSMIFGIIDIGVALYNYNFVAEASREASRYAMIHGSSCSGCVATQTSIQSYVQNLGYPGIASAQVTAAWPDTTGCTPSASPCNNPGNNVQVTVTDAFPLRVPFVPTTTWNLTSTSEVIIAQ